MEREGEREKKESACTGCSLRGVVSAVVSVEYCRLLSSLPLTSLWKEVLGLQMCTGACSFLKWAPGIKLKLPRLCNNHF